MKIAKEGSSMKKKIIVEKRNKENNGYKCDMNKPYSFADDQVVGLIFAISVITFMVVGIILLVTCTPPPVSEDPTKIFPLIVFFLIGLLEIPMFTYYCAKAIREKKHLTRMLKEAIVFTGTMTFIQKEKQGAYRVTVKLDNSNEMVDLITKSRYFILNKKIAIAKNRDKNFILTKCTLI
jgi:hypothetical protein